MTYLKILFGEEMNKYIVFGLLIIIGCYFVVPNNNQYFSLELREAQQRLSVADPPHFVFGSEGPDFKRLVDNDEVSWVAYLGNREVFRYVASLSDTGFGKTRVSLSLKASEEGGEDSIEQKLKANPTIRNLYEVAMQEQIAATLEARPFQMNRIGTALGLASLSNMAALRRSASEAASAQDERDRLAIKQAYEKEAAGIR